MIKILTKNGVENTNIDGARANYISTGRTIGVIKGVLKESNLFTLTDSYIAVNPCEMSVYGHRVVITEPEYITTSDTTARDTPYFLMGTLTVTESNVTFRLFLQNSLSGVSYPNWFSGVSGVGECTFSLCRFRREGTKNSQLTRLIESITGSVKIVQVEGDDENSVMSQKATTEAIEKGLPEKVVDSNIFRATMSIHTYAYSSGSGGAVQLMNQKITTDSPLYQTFEFSGPVYGDYSGTSTCRIRVSPSDLVKGGLLRCEVETVFNDTALGTETTTVWLVPATKEEVENYEYDHSDSRSLYHIDIEKNSAYYNALNLLASKDYYGNSVFSNAVIAKPTGTAVVVKDSNPVNPIANFRMVDGGEADVLIYSKNLVDLSTASTKYGSFHYTDFGEIVWESRSKYYLEFPISIPSGIRVSLSMNFIYENALDSLGRLRFIRTDESEAYGDPVIEGNKARITLTPKSGSPINRVRIYKSDPTADLNGSITISNLQVEFDYPTEYAPYTVPVKTIIPASGLQLTVNTNGVTVVQQTVNSERNLQATYTQDINSTISHLTKRLSALESATI